MTITILGTGKVAWQLTQALHQANHEILQIFGRNISAATRLASKVKATAINDYSEIINSDVLIIAVSDKSIAEVSSNIPVQYNGIITHTSGATSTDILSKTHKRVGAFYPLYSFPSKRKRSLAKVPFLISSYDKKIVNMLGDIARSISSAVYEIEEAHRIQLHLAAVFANNFSNYMMTKAFDICEENHLNKSILLPIISQGAAKWRAGLSKNQQTGPAKRGDQITMDKHIEIFKSLEDKELYITISDHIKHYYS